MFTQLSIFGTLFFAAASGQFEIDELVDELVEDTCDNQNRDSCPDSAKDIGPDTPGVQEWLSADDATDVDASDDLESTTGFDGKGVFPNPKELAMTICVDASMKGKCTNAWTGKTNRMPSGWNDVVSSSHIKSFYRCKFWADVNEGRTMITLAGPYTVNWVRSWNDCISSFACERTCTKTQSHCVTSQGGCISNTYRKCKTCHAGYLRNSSGKCVQDVECTGIELIIKEVKASSETDGLPDAMTLYSSHEDNCDSPTEATVTLSGSRTVSHMVDTSYTFSKSYKSTMGGSMSTSVSLTVKGEIIPGFGADVTTKVDQSSSWSKDVSSSSAKTTHQQKITSEVWSHSSTIVAEPYHNLTYTSIGRSTPGKIQWTGTMNCYNKANVLLKTKEVEGTYAGANIYSFDEKRSQVPCGAPAGFKLLKDVQCNANQIDPDVTYPTLYDAQNACQKLAEKCYGVMDKACDGVLDYYLCANNGVALKTSKINSCVYEQIQDKMLRSLSARLTAAEEQLRSFA